MYTFIYCDCLLGVFHEKAIQEKTTDKPGWTLRNRFALVEVYSCNKFFSLLFIASDFSVRFNKLFSPHTLFRRSQKREIHGQGINALAKCRLQWEGWKTIEAKIILFPCSQSHNIHETLFFVSTSPKAPVLCPTKNRKVFFSFDPLLLLPPVLPGGIQWDGKSIHSTNNILLFWINFAFSPKSLCTEIMTNCVYTYNYGCQIRLKF